MSVDVLLSGLLGSCVSCGRSSHNWAEHADQLHCVCDRWDCLVKMAEALEEQEKTSTVRRAGGSRGVFARRGATRAGSAPRAASRYGLDPGSPYWRPGMLDGAPWTALAETNYGQVMVPCGTNEAHARKVVRGWRTLAESGYEVGHGGRYAVAGTVVDPRGEFSDEWGDVIVASKPRWSPIWRVRDWTRCTGCDVVLWPGCLASVADGQCVSCVSATESDDPRVWPDEPRDPGLANYPPHLGGPKKTKAKPAAKAES